MIYVQLSFQNIIYIRRETKLRSNQKGERIKIQLKLSSIPDRETETVSD